MVNIDMMDPLDPKNAHPALKPVLTGIRLTLGEIRDIKGEIREIKGEIRDIQRRGDEDRRKADEDRRRSDEKFAQYVADSARREKELSRALVVIGRVGRMILKNQDMHTELLRAILGAIRVRNNGHAGRK